MKAVSLNKNFSERNGKYAVNYNTYSDIGIYTASSEYYSSAYEEDIRVSVTMSTEDGVVTDLTTSVKIINIKRKNGKRELIAVEVKQSIAKHVEQLKSRHNNVLDIDFIKDVVSFILNYNVCNRYEVVIEDEVVVEEAKVVEEVIKPKQVDKVGFDRGFKVNVNGLAKSYTLTTEEVESSYGYTDIVYKIEAKSTVLIDGEYALIRAYIEVYDGVVTYVHIGRDNNHLQLESFLDSMNANLVSKKVNELIEDIKYELDSYVGEKDINFAYSILAMVLNINSFDTNSYLINNTTYNLVDVA